MKRIILIILSAALLVSVLVIPAGAGFSDVNDSNTAENIAVLQMMGVINGYPDGTFKPEGTLTRAEFCKLVVHLKGDSGKISQYSKLNIFPDVLSGHWASGYINYSVRALSILSGRPDGKFYPDDTITYGEAVTILVRMLGYSDSDAGAQWPAGYINVAIQTGLSDGLSLSGGSAITRAQCMQLLVNMLDTSIKDSADSFLSTISSKQLSGVIILSLDTTADDGTEGCIETIGGDTGIYKPVNAVPAEFEGRRGTLVLNNSGYALTFIPDKNSSGSKTFTIAEAKYTYILTTDGTKVTIQSDTAVYLDGEEVEYTDIWLDLKKGTAMKAYYTASGKCDYLFITTAESSDEAVVLNTEPSGAYNPLISLFGLPSGGSYTIIKNGVEVSPSALRKYDVATYAETTNTFYVSDFSLAGIYEYAFPNADTPTKISLLGHEFNLLESAREELASIGVGESVTLLFTADDRVASVLKGTGYKALPIGVVTSAASSKATVRLLNGMEISGQVYLSDYSAAQYLGAIVTVASRQSGYISMNRVSLSAPGSDYNVKAGTIGQAALSENVKIYDRVGTCMPVEVTVKDINYSSVPASKILHTGYDSEGKADFIIFDDVTGECYSYGYIKLETEEETIVIIDEETNEKIGEKTTYTRYIRIKDSDDDTRYRYTTQIPSNLNGKPGGIVGNLNGYLASHVTLTEISGLSRSDFDGSDYVIYKGEAIPISSRVRIYIADKDIWTDSVTEARTYSNNLNVYYDRTISDGGKIRIIIAN